ncbi:MAG: hypothetical protein ACOX8O_02040 [Christensenellales bacterium]
MCDFIKRNKWAISIIGVFPIIVYFVLIYFLKNLTDGDKAVFIGAILAYYGTFFLGFAAIYQNDNLKRINEKLLDFESEDRSTYIDIDNNNNDLTVYFNYREVDIDFNDETVVFHAKYCTQYYDNDTIALELYLKNISNHFANVELDDFDITVRETSLRAISFESNHTLILPNAIKKAQIIINGLRHCLKEKPERLMPIEFIFKMGLRIRNRFDVITNENLIFSAMAKYGDDTHTTDIYRYTIHRLNQ